MGSPQPGYGTPADVFDTFYDGPCHNTTTPLTVWNAGKALASGRKWLSVQLIHATADFYSSLSIDGHKM